MRRAFDARDREINEMRLARRARREALDRSAEDRAAAQDQVWAKYPLQQTPNARAEAEGRDAGELARKRIPWHSDHPEARAYRQRYGFTNVLPVRNDQDYLSEEEAEGRRFGMEQNGVPVMNFEKARDQLEEYGYSLTDTLQIRKADKTFPVVVSAKGQRFYVKQLSGAPLWSGPDLGDFVKSFWYAKKIQRLSPNASSPKGSSSASSKLEWIKGPGVDSDGHSLAWWKSKVAKWKSQYDRPTVFIQVLCWDRTGASTRKWPQFDPSELKEAKAWAKEFIESTGGSCQVDGRVTIPYHGSVTIPLGEWKNNASNGYYVWSVDGETFVPAARNGPFENPDDAVALAKRVARGGQTYDAVITFGGDPEATDFEIWKSFKAWSGEVHYTTDLPKVGGRLREYR